MSTYESDHNINRDGQRSTNTVNPDSSHVTLADAINRFFESSNSSPSPSNGHRQESELVAAMISGLQSMHTDVSPELIRQLEPLLASIANSNGDPLNMDESNGGVPDEFFDRLDRIDKKKLKPDDVCSICTSNFLDDEYPLVVKLAQCGHKYDLDCIKPWLSIKKSCPLCRVDVLEKRKIEVPEDSEEEEYDDMYG